MAPDFSLRLSALFKQPRPYRNMQPITPEYLTEVFKDRRVHMRIQEAADNQDTEALFIVHQTENGNFFPGPLIIGEADRIGSRNPFFIEPDDTSEELPLYELMNLHNHPSHTVHPSIAFPCGESELDYYGDLCALGMARHQQKQNKGIELRPIMGIIAKNRTIDILLVQEKGENLLPYEVYERFAGQHFGDTPEEIADSMRRTGAYNAATLRLTRKGMKGLKGLQAFGFTPQITDPEKFQEFLQELDLLE